MPRGRTAAGAALIALTCALLAAHPPAPPPPPPQPPPADVDHRPVPSPAAHHPDQRNGPPGGRRSGPDPRTPLATHPGPA
ncbi:hypothetical protein [Streptomyces sp. NPDC020141]|uniref:hypothetical protein n=1 Tax=Streptomyces sp. NPDC020141 TaxID=3365065 RepID=UPI003799DBEF